MTTGNANLEDLTDEQLEAAQRLADGETSDTNPNVDPNATADAGTAGDDPAKTADATTTLSADAAAATAAGADAGADAATPKVEGIASKDGSRILPYAALQAERRSARIANSRYESTAKELEEAKQLIADLKAGKTPESLEITEADVAQMEEDYPEQGKKMRALYDRAQALAEKVPKSSAATDAEVGDDPVQEAIDQVPLLLEWQNGDAEKFDRAIEHDTLLKSSPKWRDKSAVDRFTHVAKLVAEEYDIPFPEAKTSTKTPTPSSAAEIAAAAQRTAPNTLSDFKGGAVPDHGQQNFQKMAPTAMLGAFMEMTDAEMDAQLAKLG